jgi:hypothetical protein
MNRNALSKLSPDQVERLVNPARHYVIDALANESMTELDEEEARWNRVWQSSALAFFRMKGVSEYWKRRSEQEGENFVFREVFARLGPSALVDQPKAQEPSEQRGWWSELKEALRNAVMFQPALAPATAFASHESEAVERFHRVLMAHDSQHQLQVMLFEMPESNKIMVSAVTKRSDLRGTKIKVDLEVQGTGLAFSGVITIGDGPDDWLRGECALGESAELLPLLNRHGWTSRLQLLQ